MPDSLYSQPPELSPALREIVAGLNGDLEADAREVTQQLLRSIDDYESVIDPSAARELNESVRHNLSLWYRALLERTPVDDHALQQHRDMSARRVHQGVSLSALLRAYRVGSSLIWKLLLGAVRDHDDLHQEVLFTVSPYLLAHFDRVARESAEAYSREMNQSTRWRGRLRAEIWNIVRNRPEDIDSFNRHSETLGLDVSPPYCTLALRMKDFPNTPSQQETQLDRMIDATARVLGIRRKMLFRVFHNDSLLIWAPVPGATSALAFDLQLAGQARRILDAAANVTAIGIGLPGVGPSGWALSAEQAMKALQDHGDQHGEAVWRYSDIMLDDAVGQIANTARFFDSIIDRLAQEANLLDTLKAYFQHSQHRKTTAEALHVHPNTLDYRLRRIEEILGAELQEPAWQAKLHTALSRHR